MGQTAQGNQSCTVPGLRCDGDRRQEQGQEPVQDGEEESSVAAGFVERTVEQDQEALEELHQLLQEDQAKESTLSDIHWPVEAWISRDDGGHHGKEGAGWSRTDPHRRTKAPSMTHRGETSVEKERVAPVAPRKASRIHA